jgi:hypothetical protein
MNPSVFNRHYKVLHHLMDSPQERFLRVLWMKTFPVSNSSIQYRYRFKRYYRHSISFHCHCVCRIRTMLLFFIVQKYLSRVFHTETWGICWYAFMWILYSKWLPPLWSSGQSSWLQIRRPGFDSRHYQKKKVVGLERDPLSLVSTT